MRIVLLAGLLIIASPACAEYGMAGDLEPATYESSSGAYSVRVVPSTREGAGPATYTLKHNGKVVWSGQRSLTMWRAAVAEDGTVVGYAYSTGFNQDFEDLGSFVVVRIDGAGELARVTETPRENSPFLHDMANPKASGVFVDEDDDRFVVTVRSSDLNQGADSWWAFRLSTGDALARVVPAAYWPSGARAWIVDARPLPDRPLVVIHWSISGEPHASLVDLDGRPYWQHALSPDTSDGPTVGQILDPDDSESFALWDKGAGKRVGYVIAGNGTDMKVIERSRSAYRAPAKPTTALSIDGVPKRTLELLGTLVIGKSTKPEDRIADFILRDDGRIGVVSSKSCGESDKEFFLVRSTDGIEERRVELPDPTCTGEQVHAIPFGNDWIITRPGEQKRTKLVRWNDTSGKLAPLTASSVPSIDAVAPLGDGFVALVTVHDKYTMSTTLRAYDAHGRERWLVDDNVSEEAAVFSAEDVTVTTAGTVVVLENIRDALKLFDADGKYLATVDLEKSWGRDPNYPTGIEADRSGGVIVYDFHGVPNVVHMSLDGKVIAEFTPAFADGRRFDPNGNVQSDDDGTYWTSDGFALLKLDANGKVVETLGEQSTSEALGTIAGMEVTRAGMVHAVDQRTGSVHVFDRNGEALRVCHALPSDLKSVSDGQVTVAFDGSVFVKHELTGDASYVAFDARCKRIGRKRHDVDDVSPSWLFHPNAARRWVLGYKNVYLTGAAGEILRRIERSPEGDWLQSPEPAGVAADGSLAVVSNAIGFERGAPRFVATYAPDGEPRMQWPLPEGFVAWADRFAYDGRDVVLSWAQHGKDAPEELLVISETGIPRYRFTPATGRAPSQTWFVDGAQGQELWLYDGTATVDRYDWASKSGNEGR